MIGQEFKARELWVPDVLLAARNMKQGMEILKPLFSREGQKAKGKSSWEPSRAISTISAKPRRHHDVGFGAGGH